MDTGGPTTFLTCNLKSYRINPSKIQKITQTAMHALGVDHCDLSVRFVAPASIRKLNADYRGKDRSTDVLAFPQTTFKAPKRAALRKLVPKKKKTQLPTVLGDVVISLKNAEQNSEKIGQRLDREVAFLLVHGILHLCGHDHMDTDEERKMLREQRKLMKMLSSDKSPLWKNCVSRGVGH